VSCVTIALVTKKNYIILLSLLDTYHSRFITKGITEVSQIFLRERHIFLTLHSPNLVNTADKTGGKTIAVSFQSISGVSAINHLVAFYDIHGGKREILLFCPGHHTKLSLFSYKKLLALIFLTLNSCKRNSILKFCLRTKAKQFVPYYNPLVFPCGTLTY
jgi:hypothetical protein